MELYVTHLKAISQKVFQISITTIGKKSFQASVLKWYLGGIPTLQLAPRFISKGKVWNWSHRVIFFISVLIIHDIVPATSIKTSTIIDARHQSW